MKSAPYREPANVQTLCRLLVDPKKVRVTIRHGIFEDKKQYFAFIAPRSCPTRGYAGLDERPQRALITALRLAEKGKMDGVDLSMSYAFPHPQGRVIDREENAEARQLALDVALLLEGELS